LLGIKLDRELGIELEIEFRHKKRQQVTLLPFLVVTTQPVLL